MTIFEKAWELGLIEPSAKSGIDVQICPWALGFETMADSDAACEALHDCDACFNREYIPPNPPIKIPI